MRANRHAMDDGGQAGGGQGVHQPLRIYPQHSDVLVGQQSFELLAHVLHQRLQWFFLHHVFQYLALQGFKAFAKANVCEDQHFCRRVVAGHGWRLSVLTVAATHSALPFLWASLSSPV